MSAEPANLADPASDHSAAPKRRPQWARILPVLVLLVAIIGQITLMTTVNIDRQTGSGFAMFSSVDFAGSRTVVVTASFDGQSVQVGVPPVLDDRVDRLLYAPTDAGAEQLANELSPMTWDERDGRVVLGDTGSIQDITVVIRGLTADGHELSSQVLARGAAE